MPNQAEPNRIVNALTIDVEDYFQVSAFESVVQRDDWGSYQRRVALNTERILELLAQHRTRATFFVLGWIAEQEPSLVERIAGEGHEIASHGYAHRLVYDQTPQQFRDDVRRSKDILEVLAGVAVSGYRAPSFSITARSLWALDILSEEGYQYDASIFPIHHDRYGIPTAPRYTCRLSSSSLRAQGGALNRSVDASAAHHGDDGHSILEVPASTLRLFGLNIPIAGGGYFRLLPYGWTRWGIHRVNEIDGKPVVFYLHPWELDTDQPRLPARAFSRFRHYRNLHRTCSRLDRLLSEFSFDSVAAVLLASAEFAPTGGLR